MTTTIDLDPFRNAKTLLWHQWTVWAPHQSDDGTLIADGVHKLPLDTYTTASLTGGRKKWPPMTNRSRSTGTCGHAIAAGSSSTSPQMTIRTALASRTEG
jgi:hypothetical protein